MTLDEFVQSVGTDLAARFGSDWTSRNLANPAGWPLTGPATWWRTEFEAFCDVLGVKYG